MKRWLGPVILLSLIGCDGIRLTPGRTLASIEIDPSDVTILEGEPLELTVVARDNNGELIEIPSWRKPQWRIRDQDIIQIQRSEAVGIRGGETEVRVAISGLVSDPITIRVNPLWDVSASNVYITQAVHDSENALPLIAGREGMLRAFLTLDGFHIYDPPEVGLELSDISGRVLVDTILTQTYPRIFTRTDESDFAFSYNYPVPAEFVQRGLTATLHYDPENKQKGISGTETIQFEVRRLPDFGLTIVPVITTAEDREPQLSTIEWANEIRDKDHSVHQFTRNTLPVASIDLKAREPYITDVFFNNRENTRHGWEQLIREVRLLRSVDNSRDYYYGALRIDYSNRILGLGFIGGKTSVGDLNAQTLAHEIGHNMSLRHAPCHGQGSSLDPGYPNQTGSIEVWGWNPSTNRLLSPNRWSDMMSLCPIVWISAFHFRKAIVGREALESRVGYARSAQPTLVIWGSVRSDGEIILEPAVTLESSPSTEDEYGTHVAEGFDLNGDRAFTHRFSPLELDHYESSSFILSIPYDGSALSSITVSGPGGTRTLTEGSHPPVAMIFENGRLKSVRRNWTDRLRGEVVYSTGLPTPNRN